MSLVKRQLTPVQQTKDSPQAIRPAGAPYFNRSTATSEGLRLWSELARPLGNRTDQPGVTYSPAGADPPHQDFSAIEQLRAWTELALINYLLNGRALSILGQLAHASGDEARAAQFLNAAVRISIRDSVAVYWLLRKSCEAQDYATAVYCADALLDNVLAGRAGRTVLLVEMA